MYEELLAGCMTAKTNADRADMIFRISLALVEERISQEQNNSLVRLLAEREERNGK